MIRFFVGDRDRYPSLAEAREAFGRAFPGEGEAPEYFEDLSSALDSLSALDRRAGYAQRAPGEGESWEQMPLPQEAIIYVLPGIYKEHPGICRSNLRILGAGRSQVFFLGARGGRDAFGPDPKRGTFRSQTVFVHARRVTMENLTIANLAGQGRSAGQAIALYADGDELIFRRLDLIGRQDTLFCGPLPEREVEPGGFTGPLKEAPRVGGRHLYDHCHIEGTIDFIFGSATAFFEKCDILSVDPREEGEEKGEGPGEKLGFVTAPSTPQGAAYGFVFWNCTLRGECPRGSIYLGRPWREYAKCVYLNCQMEGHISPQGWDDWNKPLARENCFFAEYGCTGEGAQIEGAQMERASFARRLSMEEAKEYGRERVLGF